jgi:hypothetical protein
MANTSFFSDSIFSIRVPKVLNPSAKFTYNYYIEDESINENSGIPDYIIGLSGQNVPTETLVFTRKVPRFVTINWESPDPSADFSYDITNNLQKIVTEDELVNSKFVPYTFSDNEMIESAYKDINKDGKLDLGTSQATNIDNYINSLVTQFSLGQDEAQKQNVIEQLSFTVSNLEKIADQPSQTMGIGYIDENGQEIQNTSGLAQLLAKSEVLSAQINSLIVSDLFVSASLPQSTMDELNDYYESALQTNPKNQSIDTNDAAIVPIEIVNVSLTKMPPATFQIVGYVVEKYENSKNGYVKKETFTFNNSKNTTFVDFRIKYSKKYFYGIRTVAKVSMAGLEESTGVPQAKLMRFLISSKPVFTSVSCIENVPPPPPRDVYFNWDHSRSKLVINWEDPYNYQRDIKQYQVFRRKSIYDPFELIAQKHFDKSAKLWTTGEQVDGNRQNIVNEAAELIERGDKPINRHVDHDFKIDAETLTSSKYIYAMASVDAHGILSCYGPQFEVTFDFYKNKLVKNVISNGEAPRQYPNLYLKRDLFKDTIKVSGEASMVMKVYFMPEYFKISNNNNELQQIVMTNQDGAHYQLQFINVQNQKSQNIKITIDDPAYLCNVTL